MERTERVALNADVVGYSALIADDLAATTTAMATLHRVVEERVSSNGGTVANFVGDSFMAVFPDAASALRAAIAITTTVEDLNRDTTERRRTRFRMGLDLGAISETESGFHGDALNIAARIQAVAPVGGLAVSGRVYRELDEPALRFRAMGRQRLKNIPEQIEVYEFADLPTDRLAIKGSPELRLELPSVALLPIHTEMVDDRVRAAAGVVRADLLHRLSELRQISLIDAGQDRTTPETSARYILETGVHQFGDTVRIFATLLDTGTINVVKSYKWTSPASELVALSDTIADEVANGLLVDLIIGAPAGLFAEMNDPKAMEDMYLGWYHFRSETPEGWAQAVELFDSVRKAHPEAPYGYVLKAYALWLGASSGWTESGPALDEAYRLALRGAELGDPTGMAQALESAVLMSQGKIDEALLRLDGLEKVRPTCDVTYALEGSVRRYLGDWERAVELCDTAMRLTGLNKPWYPTVKAASLFVGGQSTEAAILAESVLEYQPNNLEALLILAAAQVESGMERRAKATAELIRERFPAVDAEEWLEKNPYQHREIVDRWKDDLTSAGAIV